MQEALQARPRIDRSQILKSAGALGLLGTASHNLPRILKALCSRDISGADIAKLVNTEPAMYARILRVANSPYYGQSRTITTIDRALVVLGLDAVRGIAAAACLDRTVQRTDKSRPLVDMGAVIRHSIATACAAEALARVRHPDLASEAFIAGLLHNLGIVVQAHLDRTGIQAFLQARQRDAQGDMRTLEAGCIAVGHEECGGVIFDEWQLPETLIAAARAHHDPMSAGEPHRTLTSLIHLGGTLGLACGATFALEPKPADRSHAAMEWLDLEDGQLDGVSEGLSAKVDELQKALLLG